MAHKLASNLELSSLWLLSAEILGMCPYTNTKAEILNQTWPIIVSQVIIMNYDPEFYLGSVFIIINPWVMYSPP